MSVRVLTLHPVLGPSTTQLFRNLSFAMKWQPGDEIIVSKLDHEANVASWVDIAARLNLTLKWWAPAPSTNPRLDTNDLMVLLTPRTRLVACTHASNLLGTIHDIKSIASIVHSRPNAMLCVDAVAYAPHRRIDVKALGVDFYAFSWYKVYGPHIAVLYGSQKAQEQMTSLGHYFNPSGTLENKLGLAGANYELTQAIPKVVQYLDGIGDFSAHEEKLAEILLTYLRGREDVTIYGESTADAKVRVPTISFAVKGWSSREVVETIEKQTVFGFRWGHFYSKRLCDDVLKTSEEGVVRVSMVSSLHVVGGKIRADHGMQVHYNTEAEIRSFVEAFDKHVPSR
jgi:selenocysteine lyase/cysteine desulfurase